MTDDVTEHLAERLREAVGGEHGLGRTKAAAGASYKSEAEVDLMRAIKDTLDPQGLMNPGALLPAPPRGS